MEKLQLTQNADSDEQAERDTEESGEPLKQKMLCNHIKSILIRSGNVIIPPFHKNSDADHLVP